MHDELVLHEARAGSAAEELRLLARVARPAVAHDVAVPEAVELGEGGCEGVARRGVQPAERREDGEPRVGVPLPQQRVEHAVQVSRRDPSFAVLVRVVRAEVLRDGVARVDGQAPVARLVGGRARALTSPAAAVWRFQGVVDARMKYSSPSTSRVIVDRRWMGWTGGGAGEGFRRKACRLFIS